MNVWMWLCAHVRDGVGFWIESSLCIIITKMSISIKFRSTWICVHDFELCIFSGSWMRAMINKSDDIENRIFNWKMFETMNVLGERERDRYRKVESERVRAKEEKQWCDCCDYEWVRVRALCVFVCGNKWAKEMLRLSCKETNTHSDWVSECERFK